MQTIMTPLKCSLLQASTRHGLTAGSMMENGAEITVQRNHPGMTMTILSYPAIGVVVTAGVVMLAAVTRFE